MLDLPFSKLSKLIHILQDKRTLGITQAYSREFLLYTTFCCEMYAYQTAASDLQQRLSGIEHAIEACDGLNFGKTLETLCLVQYGKINSLNYREQVECYEKESEFVALRLLQAACGAFVCLKLVEKGKGPRHWFWKKHPEVYKIAVLRARDQRIRTLGNGVPRGVQVLLLPPPPPPPPPAPPSNEAPIEFLAFLIMWRICVHARARARVC